MAILLVNPYSQFLRTLADTQLDACEIHIRSDIQLDQRVYNAPSSNLVAAIWIEGNNPIFAQERDIIVRAHSGHRHRVRHYYGCYDPLQYPILFPRGEVGWHQNILEKDSDKATSNPINIPENFTAQNLTCTDDIFRQEQQGVDSGGMRKVSCRQYYSYKLQIRDTEQSILLLSGRLLQQFVVNMYIKLETTRLDYNRQKQDKFRAELYQGIVDSVLSGKKKGNMVGKRIVLPASFIGGPRDMRRRYLDAMSLVQRFGKPNIFLTMTCNLDWKEIQDELKEGQLVQDRPDLTARVFQAKSQDLKDQLFKKHIFGKVAAYVYVIEFQKRGLPHAHLLIILKSDHKITCPDQFDKYVCAEIPDPDDEPELHAIVVKHMMHVKYLYKYVYKSHDKVAVYIGNNDGDAVIDEIHLFQDARWVSAQEAMWRIFEFDLNEIYPVVINLQLHLPNKQFVSYWENQNLENVIYSDVTSRTMLTEFFNTCNDENDKEAKGYLYREFPEHYVWNKQGKFWSKRKTREVIGHINGVNPSEGERYYLRLLLNHVRGPTSFLQLLNHNGVQHQTFKEASQQRGLLQSNDYISECLQEAANFQMPLALRWLFATILVYCEPYDVRKLWDVHFEAMSEDFSKIQSMKQNLQVSKTLQSIEYFLESMGRSIKDYDLPPIELIELDITNMEKREIADELLVSIPYKDLLASSTLNPEQEDAYNIIMERLNSNQGGIFFIDGPRGTSKTYLYCALIATVRSRNMIAIATATSGVAASIMPGGRTAHSRFKIPIDRNESTMCNMPKQSGMAELLRTAKLIIWDEAPMAKRRDIEAVDRTLKDIMTNTMLFGGKVAVFGGDFCQVLPVVPRSTRAETVYASLVKSYLWSTMEKLKLTRNMRALSDSTFSDFLLRIGNGNEPTRDEDMVEIPEQMLIKYENPKIAENSLINSIFPSLERTLFILLILSLVYFTAGICSLRRI